MAPPGRKPGYGWQPTDEEMTNLIHAYEFALERKGLIMRVRFNGGPGAVHTLATRLNKSGNFKGVVLRSYKRKPGYMFIEIAA